jgi:hypothetical protein
MSERYTRFTIGNGEETECPECAWPLDKGERAVLVRSDYLECEYVTCSKMCHKRAVEAVKLLDDDIMHNAVGCEA